MVVISLKQASYLQFPLSNISRPKKNLIVYFDYIYGAGQTIFAARSKVPWNSQKRPKILTADTRLQPHTLVTTAPIYTQLFMNYDIFDRLIYKKVKNRSQTTRMSPAPPHLEIQKTFPEHKLVKVAIFVKPANFNGSYPLACHCC